MRALVVTVLSLALGLTALTGLVGSPATAADSGVVVQTLHFRVTTGPQDKVCDVVGDLYLPADASSTTRVPAILTTNGFSGSKDDQAGLGEAFAKRGYAVLSYSGLGFGGSDCPITLDDPDWDGKAGAQLVSYLGGAEGIAFTDDTHTTPAPVLDVIVHDATAHDGTARAHDPRVGMIGGSYGGAIQFAIASVDPRLDTIVPIITWNDLTYSLGPNNTDQTTGVTTATPGATKLTWGLFFSALGMVNGVQNAPTDPGRLLGCPNFVFFVCPALVTAGTLGYFLPDALGGLRHASVASYVDRVRIPTLLMQGQQDTLFNLNEAVATYEALEAQGTEVKMIWQSWGHSGSAAPGEIDLSAPDPATQYQTARVVDWFEHHLKDVAVSTGPEFAWFRDWIDYEGNAAPAYASSDSFPVGEQERWILSGGKQLVQQPPRVTRSTQHFLTPVAGVPTRLESLDAIGEMFTMPLPEDDLPGTFADWSTAPLADDVDVVGSPTLDLQVNSLTAQLTQGLGPAGKLVLFVRLQDVAPDGTATDIRLLTAPVRVSDVREPFRVTMPAIVHRFAEGHRIRLVVAGGSVNYRGGLTTNLVSIRTGSTDQALRLPVTD